MNQKTTHNKQELQDKNQDFVKEPNNGMELNGILDLENIEPKLRV